MRKQHNRFGASRGLKIADTRNGFVKFPSSWRATGCSANRQSWLHPGTAWGESNTFYCPLSVEFRLRYQNLWSAFSGSTSTRHVISFSWDGSRIPQRRLRRRNGKSISMDRETYPPMYDVHDVNLSENPEYGNKRPPCRYIPAADLMWDPSSHIYTYVGTVCLSITPPHRKLSRQALGHAATHHLCWPWKNRHCISASTSADVELAPAQIFH